MGMLVLGQVHPSAIACGDGGGENLAPNMKSIWLRVRAKFMPLLRFISFPLRFQYRRQLFEFYLQLA